MKEIAAWKDVPCLWVGRTNIVKMSTLPKAIYRFNVIPMKIPIALSTQLEQIILKCVWNHKRPQRAKAILRKNKAGGNHNPRFQGILRSCGDQDRTAVAQNRHIDQ